MDSERKVSDILNNSPKGSRLRGIPKNRWWNCVQYKQILINAKLQTGKRGKKFYRADWEKRSALWRRRSWTGHVDKPSLELLLMMITLHFVN